MGFLISFISRYFISSRRIPGASSSSSSAASAASAIEVDIQSFVGS
jgi:hypothetical protein